MRNLLSITLILSTLFSWAQKDSVHVDINNVLRKLGHLEKQNDNNDTVSFTDTSYASSFGPKDKSPILKAGITFDTVDYNMGNIIQGVIVKQRFTFINTGTNNLEIINVVADCSCTSPDWTKDIIKPGEKGFVIATYDSKEDIGKFMKTITVLHNSGEGYTFLEIKGFVAPKL
ncbi:MAG: hypothetical protein COA58_07330 [Bacteroidetes bacterium]|nr:MAG: hypothetical protein COA58_07330 [Bacteroidota bacterium]